ncbi:MAG: TOMM precursor leader peptide-binding protein [Kineosporiaceae bacterium]|nr:TOMM precursor leader peptide-binding protein [Aeromicrobium sp.]
MTIRPALRPGAVLLRRDATHLQIGTSPGFVLRDRPGLFSVLRLLDGIRDVRRIADLTATHLTEFDGNVPAIINELMAAGLVFDARNWDFPADPRLVGEARSASLTGSPPARLHHRAEFGLRLSTDKASTELARTTVAILARAGISTTAGDQTHLAVMLSNGEPGRQRFQEAMESGIDHVRVVVEEDRIRIGPLVRPGITPCINCHDLHRTDWDNAWPALMTQFGASTAFGSPPALCATTLHVAAATIAAEVLAHCDDTAGETTGQCLVVGPHYLDHQSWPVSFHPNCSCTLLAAA